MSSTRSKPTILFLLIAFKKLAPEKILALSFASFILFGAAVLMIPAATVDGSISFIDALFTTTSATCVTGLAVVDTGSYFSGFGQAVILISIQLGGIGIMTFSTFLLYIFGKRLSVRDAEMLSKTLARTRGMTPRGLLWTVIAVTLLIEAVGALLLYGRFTNSMSDGQALWASVFHSISAFCNAGFSVFRDNLVGYSADMTVNIVIMLLIIFGGIGFIVFLELFRFTSSRLETLINEIRKGKKASYLSEAPFRFSIHSKIVITVTSILILTGAAGIAILEYDNVQKGMGWGERLLTSLFQSVTPRTAGFNTLDIGMMSDTTLFLILMLMFIGAAPGSCAGGIKVSTFAVLYGMIRSAFRREEDVTFFRRTISKLVQAEAVTLTFLAVLVVIVAALLLQVVESFGMSHLETRGKFIELLFETVSAFGTVGLSTGITPSLNPWSKLVLILVMFVGRLGPLTLAIAISRRRRGSQISYPEGRVIIG